MERLRAADANQLESSLTVAAMFAGYLKADCYQKIEHGELVDVPLNIENRELFLQGIKSRLIDALNDIRLIELFNAEGVITTHHTPEEIENVTVYLKNSVKVPTDHSLTDLAHERTRDKYES